MPQNIDDSLLTNFAAYNDLPSHVWAADARGQLVFTNKAWVEYSGSPTDVVIERGLASVIHPEDVEHASRVWRACLRDATALHIQVRLRSRVGGYHWFSVNAEPTLDENGKLTQFIGINTQVYDSRTSSEISLSPDLMVALIESSCQYQMVFDPTRKKIIFSNRPNETLFGFPIPTEFSDAEELYTYIHEEDREKMVSTISENLRGNSSSVQFRVVAPNAPARFLYECAVPILNADRIVTAIILRVTDLTDEVMSKEENQKLLGLYALVLKTITDGVWLADQNTAENIITSAAYNALCGYPPESKVTSKMWFDRIHPEDQPLVEAHLKHQKKGERIDIEYRIVHPDGKTLWILSRTLPTEQFGGLPVVCGVMVDITDLKKEHIRIQDENKNLGQRVEETTSELQQLFDNTPIGHHSLDSNGKFISVNRTELDWLGYTEEEMLNKTFRDLLAPGQEEIFKLTFENFMATGSIFDYPYLLKRKDGSDFPVLINATSKKDEDGKFLYSYSTMFDNTNLSNAQKKLTEQELRYHSIFSQSPEMIYLRDFETNQIIEANQATLRGLGYSLEELKNIKLEDLILDPILPPVLHKQLLKTGSIEPAMRKFKTKNGRLLDLEVSITLARDGTGKPSTVQFICRDMTARLETERKLKQQRAFVQQLLDTLKVGVVVTNVVNQIDYLNYYLADFLGVNGKDLINKPIDSVLPQELFERITEVISRTKTTGELSIEAPLPRHDGTLRQFLILIADRGGEGGVIMTLVDITSEKELEANLVISRDSLQRANTELEKAVKLKDEFLANMSHELRTPLTGIIGLTGILLTEQLGALTAQQKELMRNIEESGEHLHVLFNEILDLSRIEAGKFELQMRFFPINDLCMQSIKMVEGLALKKRIELIQDPIDGKPLVYGDQRRLKQALVNLLGNALKFTPRDGKVGLRISVQPEKENIRISVWDNGIGIPPENIDLIFQPFVQLESNLSRQFAGTGLGLALSRHIVDMHNGTLTVESEVNKGSVFHIDLPYHPEPLLNRMGVGPNDNTAILSTDHLRTAIFPVCVNADPSDLIKKFKTAGVRIYEPVDLAELEALRLRKVNMIIFLPSKAVSKKGDIWIKSIRTSKELNNTMIIKIDSDSDPLLGGVKVITNTASIEQAWELMDQTFRENWQTIEGSFIGTTTNHILVVEDNSINRMVMVDFLRGKGFRVTEATNGEEAIQAASRSVPDLILMDIQMPVLNGLDATRVIRQMTEKAVNTVPIIAVTIGHHPDEIVKIYEAGCNNIIEKPIDLAKLYEVVQKLLSKEV